MPRKLVVMAPLLFITGGAFAQSTTTSDPGAAAEPGSPGAPPVGAAVSGTQAGSGGQTSPPAGAVEPSGTAEGGGAGLFEQALSAAASAPSGPAAGPAGGAPFTLNGYMRGDAFIGKLPAKQAATMKAAYGELSLSMKTVKHAYGDGFAEARLRYGLQGDQQQTFLDLREAYANVYAGPVDLRLGRQIVVWGRADLLNPTNNITPMDLRIRSPIEDDRRLGNFGARAFLKLSPIRIEGVWMPIYLPSELPPVGIPEFVAFARPTYPPPTLKRGLYAGRIHLELPAFEMSVSYLHGYAPLPGLTLSGVRFDPVSPEVSVSRTAYSHDVVGLDFSTTVGELFAIRGEAAYRRPQDYQTRPYAARPDIQYALGVDRPFGSVNVIAQYLGRYVLDWRKETGPTEPLDPSYLRDPNLSAGIMEAINVGISRQLAQTNQIIFNQTERVQHLATLRAEWLTLHETLSLTALGVVNVTTKEWLASPRIGYRLSDAVVTYVGAEIFSGPAGTLFGLVEEVLSAGYAEIRCTF